MYKAALRIIHYSCAFLQSFPIPYYSCFLCDYVMIKFWSNMVCTHGDMVWYSDSDVWMICPHFEVIYRRFRGLVWWHAHRTGPSTESCIKWTVCNRILSVVGFFSFCLSLPLFYFPLSFHKLCLCVLFLIWAVSFLLPTSFSRKGSGIKMIDSMSKGRDPSLITVIETC